MEKKEYTVTDIEVLPANLHIRKRPTMYIGSVDETGIFNLFKELIDSLAAEPCTEVTVIINDDDSITVENDGPGISVEKHSNLDKPILEVVFTTLACGSKDTVDKVMACALSEWLGVGTSYKDEIGWVNSYAMEFERGRVTSKLEMCDYEPETGLSITFLPDPEIFGDVVIDPDDVEDYIEELRQQYPDVSFSLTCEAK